jgi:hypothetical protein
VKLIGEDQQAVARAQDEMGMVNDHGTFRSQVQDQNEPVMRSRQMMERLMSSEEDDIFRACGILAADSGEVAGGVRDPANLVAERFPLPRRHIRGSVFAKFISSSAIHTQEPRELL